MKAKDLEWELLDDQGQHGQQECLADALHAGLHLRLADLIDAGDAIHALDAVEVAPVDGVDAHEPRVPIGPWSLANADRVAHWAGLGKAHASGLVVRALAQVVQVRDRQPGQAFIARVAIRAVGALPLGPPDLKALRTFVVQPRSPVGGCDPAHKSGCETAL